jgi:aryl-phospho-beta-D-glucosidase BglC (GH1 family)
MRKLVLFVTAAALCFLSPARRPVLSQPAQGSQLGFSDIVGTVGMLPNATVAKEMKVGFERVIAAWSEIEHPTKGALNWQKVDAAVQQAHSQGMGVVIDLTYTPHWATTNPTSSGATWQFFPAKNVSDWTDFVDVAVSHYMASPYEVQYFQIWNEPVKGSGFWVGTNEQWVDDVYIPAAKVIRKHGAKVVFGGWPSGSGLPAYNAELQLHNAWQYTDILDVHYYPVAQAFPSLYNQWIATGKCKGIWETEVGAQDNPQLLTQQYTSLYNWARTQGHWSFAEQYKLFWYVGFGATDNAALTRQSETPQKTLGPSMLTANGRALQALAQKLP